MPKKFSNCLSAGELRDFRVGLIHGRMIPDRKDAVMDAFRNGEIHVLVSTTVVEVGVDVPNATLMVIDEAHRFGLSQLHQLAGPDQPRQVSGLLLPVFRFRFARGSQAMHGAGDNGGRIPDCRSRFRDPWAGDVLGDAPAWRFAVESRRSRGAMLFSAKARNPRVRSGRTGEFDQPEFAMLKIKVLERLGTALDLPKTG